MLYRLNLLQSVSSIEDCYTDLQASMFVNDLLSVFNSRLSWLLCEEETFDTTAIGIIEDYFKGYASKLGSAVDDYDFCYNVRLEYSLLNVNVTVYHSKDICCEVRLCYHIDITAVVSLPWYVLAYDKTNGGSIQLGFNRKVDFANCMKNLSVDVEVLVIAKEGVTLYSAFNSKGCFIGCVDAILATFN